MTPDSRQIAALSTGRVVVVGDVMIDHYVSGRVSRVSDEAPVPIIHVADERWTPGGAANVAVNISALGGKAMLVGATGQDEAAQKLAAHLSGLARPVEAKLAGDADRPTTIKTRYMGGQHQIVRVDREVAMPVSAETEAAMIAMLTASGPAAAIVASDYAKGALTDAVLAAAIARAATLGAKLVVDPKRRDWSAYRGASVITPNRRELHAATGIVCDADDACEQAAEVVMAQTGAMILLTRSEQGMSLYRPDMAPVHMRAQAREVFDVSGAGDTVAAAIALGLASGLAIETAMGIANLAAGIVVGKRGTATASQDDLLAAAGASRSAASTGATSLGDAVAMRRRWAEQGLSVGFTNGCFDILHAGHVSLLRQAAAACDRLVVGLNSDASVSRLKGPGRPVQTEDMRAAVMAALRDVDAVVIFGEDTPLETIEALEPDVLVKGADYAEDQIVGADLVKARGGRIVRAALSEGQSTTRIVNALRGE